MGLTPAVANTVNMQKTDKLIRYKMYKDHWKKVWYYIKSFILKQKLKSIFKLVIWGYNLMTKADCVRGRGEDYSL